MVLKEGRAKGRGMHKEKQASILMELFRNWEKNNSIIEHKTLPNVITFDLHSNL
jgi:hypothetical protein